MVFNRGRRRVKKAFILDSDDEEYHKFPGKQSKADDNEDEENDEEFSDDEEDLVNQYHGLVSSKKYIFLFNLQRITVLFYNNIRHNSETGSRIFLKKRLNCRVPT